MLIFKRFGVQIRNDKEYLKFDLYDSESNSYTHLADMRILSLCKSDCKFRYEEDSTRVDVSMQK